MSAAEASAPAHPAWSAIGRRAGKAGPGAGVSVGQRWLGLGLMAGARCAFGRGWRAVLAGGLFLLATAVAPGAEERVLLPGAGRELGVAGKWEAGRFVLTRGDRRAEFEEEKREFRLDGVRVFLSGPARRHGDGLSLLAADWTQFLAPILRPAVEPAVRWPRVVVVDAGHGGRDVGAVSVAPPLLEKDAALDTAVRLRAGLEAAGFTVVLTRTADVFVPLSERPARAHAAGGDLFLSIHFNTVPNQPQVRGVETYLLPPRFLPATGDPPADLAPGLAERLREDLPGHRFDRANAVLGFAVQRRLLADLGTPDRGLKRARFAVLRPLEMPGVLFEAGFLSSPEEAKLVADPAWRQQVADGLVRALLDYRAALEQAGVRPPAPGSEVKAQPSESVPARTGPP